MQFELFEEWRAVPGYEGQYEVSSFGRVRTVEHVDRIGRLRTSVIKAQRYTGDGYLRVSFATETRGVKTTHLVADLVLLAFVGPKPSGMAVRHLNGMRDHNVLSNLCYGTPKQNGADTSRHGKLRTARRGGYNVTSISAELIEIIKSAKSGREAARLTGVSACHAKRIRAGKIKCWAA